MIQITPAILTNDINFFTNRVEVFSSFFKQIDIDINVGGDNFKGFNTLSPEDIIPVIKNYNTVFGIHLMTSNPKKEVDKFISENLSNNYIFYIHQESNIQDLLSVFYKNLQFAITVLVESELKDIHFYNQFKEVQLMTVEAGEQGRGFNEEGLKKALELHSMGYKGKISIDGGVNIESSNIIKKYPINRVSVGSYFQASRNVEESLNKLNLALNR